MPTADCMSLTVCVLTAEVTAKWQNQPASQPVPVVPMMQRYEELLSQLLGCGVHHQVGTPVNTISPLATAVTCHLLLLLLLSLGSCAVHNVKWLAAHTLLKSLLVVKQLVMICGLQPAGPPLCLSRRLLNSCI